MPTQKISIQYPFVFLFFLTGFEHLPLLPVENNEITKQTTSLMGVWLAQVLIDY